jgi:hypothetical protein
MPEDDTQVPQIDEQIQPRHSMAECGCPEQIISPKDSKTTVHNLDPLEEYFPMMSRINAQAFFGLPPTGLRPKSPEKSTFSHPYNITDISERAAQAYVEDYDSDQDLYGVSGGEHDDMEVDLPYRNSSSQGPGNDVRLSQPSINTPSTSTSSLLEADIIQVDREANGPIQAENGQDVVRLQVRVSKSKLWPTLIHESRLSTRLFGSNLMMQKWHIKPSARFP